MILDRGCSLYYSCNFPIGLIFIKLKTGKIVFNNLSTVESIMFLKFAESKIDNHLTCKRICCPSLESFTFLLPGRYCIKKKHLDQDLLSSCQTQQLFLYFQKPVLNLVISATVEILRYLNTSLPIQHLCFIKFIYLFILVISTPYMALEHKTPRLRVACFSNWVSQAPHQYNILN